MKYKIEFLERKRTSTGKDKIDATIRGEDGVNVEATLWGDFPNFGELKAGDTVDGLLKTASDPKFKPTLNPIKDYASRPSFTPKTQVIKEAQDNKARQIAQAQDRNAWMWAKNNASQLLTGHLLNGMSADDIAHEVINLATKIYNGEPTEPFN